MQDFTPNLAAGINRACCERFLSPTAAKLQYGDAGQNEHHGNVPERIDHVTYQENADHKCHNRRNIRDARSGERAEVRDDEVVADIGQARSAQPKTKNQADPSAHIPEDCVDLVKAGHHEQEDYREPANAGVAYVTPLATSDEAQYDGLMDTNVKSVFFSIQAIEPVMREGGSIILNTAWLNQVGVPGRAILSASKAAVRSFARTLSAELLGRRIRVNAVSPGLIETPILRGVGRSEHPGQSEAEFRDYLAGASKLIPIGRLGRPDEIATAPVTHPANNWGAARIIETPG